MSGRGVRAVKRLAVAALVGAVIVVGVYLMLKNPGFTTHDRLCREYGDTLDMLWRIGLGFVLLFSFSPWGASPDFDGGNDLRGRPVVR